MGVKGCGSGNYWREQSEGDREEGWGQRVRLKEEQDKNSKKKKKIDSTESIPLLIQTDFAYFKICDLLNRNCPIDKNSKDLSGKVTSVKTSLSFQRV